MKDYNVINRKILVESINKGPKKEKDQFFADVEVSDSLGVIIAMDEDITEEDSRLFVGKKVYYGNDRTRIRMSGKDVEVMSPENIVAVKNDEKEEN